MFRNKLPQPNFLLSKLWVNASLQKNQKAKNQGNLRLVSWVVYYEKLYRSSLLLLGMQLPVSQNERPHYEAILFR